jgi:hypothetical protein
MKVMKNTVLNFADGTGLGAVLLTVYMNLTDWLNVQNWNKTVLFLTSILGMVYIIFKISNLYLQNKKIKLETKKLKKNDKKN